MGYASDDHFDLIAVLITTERLFLLHLVFVQVIKIIKNLKVVVNIAMLASNIIALLICMKIFIYFLLL